MRTVRRTQMEVFEGSNLRELKESFNKTMKWVGRFSAKHSEPVINLDNYEGYVIFEESELVAEGYKDALELHGERVVCGDCKEFRSTQKQWGECRFCRGNLKTVDEPCDRFFKNWENGDCWIKDYDGRYDSILSELDCKSINGSDAERRAIGDRG